MLFGPVAQNVLPLRIRSSGPRKKRAAGNDVCVCSSLTQHPVTIVTSTVHASRLDLSSTSSLNFKPHLRVSMTIWSSSAENGGQASGSDPVVEVEAKKAFRKECVEKQHVTRARGRRGPRERQKMKYGKSCHDNCRKGSSRCRRTKAAGCSLYAYFSIRKGA